jgi:endonuclease/exonuclease/phosphatase family metal-dependent hydrolase
VWCRLAAALLVAGAIAGCAKAINYPDPAGPLHTYGYGPPLRVRTPAPGTWRVVSFNIAYGVEVDRAIEVLKRTPQLQNADIIALQEMDAPGTARIAHALGMNAVYYPSGVHPKYQRDFGCALLSPWPLVQTRKVLLPRGARVSGLRRAATSALVVRGNERVRAYSVHLPSPPAISGGARREELRVLAADCDSSTVPVVIAGDFNSYGKVAELSKAGFDWITRELGATKPVRLLGIHLFGMDYDHVLARGLRAAPGSGAMGIVKNNRHASDHLPIWTVLVPADTIRTR